MMLDDSLDIDPPAPQREDMPNSIPKSDWLIIAVIGLLIQSIWLIVLEQPSYMDAYYYASNGERLAGGHGFSEMVIWQYLDDPSGLPTPSHTYWMPLPSLLAALGHTLRGDFLGQQLVFWLLAGLLPLLAFGISLLLSGERWQAWAAALFTATGSFYGAFLSQPTTFAPFAWSGGLCLLMLGIIGASRFDSEVGAGIVKQVKKRPWLFWLLAGVFAGFAHLTRADGALLLLSALAIWLLELFLSRRSPVDNEGAEGEASVPYLANISYFAVLIGGYLVVMGVWLIRNMIVMERLLSPVGFQSIFLTTYDDLFAYGRSIDLASYLEWGWDNILLSKVESLWVAVQTIVAVPGVVFLTPFIIIALVNVYHRPEKRALVRPAVWYTIFLLFSMSFIFTFPGMRGAIFHSSSAIWPWSTALAAGGIGIAVDWIAKRLPHWEPDKAKRRFSMLFIVLAFILGIFVSLSRARSGTDADILRQVQELVPEDSIIMAGNAPAVYYHTDLPSLSVPNEQAETVYEAASRYGVTHLLLDEDTPAPLEGLYSGETSDPRFTLIEDFGEIKLYKVVAGTQ
jgi:hypothetical protein